jgi:hypothetical protein
VDTAVDIVLLQKLVPGLVKQDFGLCEDTNASALAGKDDFQHFLARAGDVLFV